ncbi:glycosyl transferase [candidate division KSB3 bacterium]|uniref:Glycosyl transferase n=1 Tax=candidate division KSB3 bacterium TaxID=2044937 RepID=A0A2G6KKM6_9BACT|nr:MAG: glycosyl transferase [candidate division KSB3 bacterium]
MQTRQKLSVAIITFNEENRIRDALESVTWADEIVVVDSMSTDRTVDICCKYTEHVYQIPWHGHVKQKQIATDKTSHDWVLSIDADERVSPELAKEIQQALIGTPRYAGYYMPRKTYYLGDWIRHCGWYPDYKLRVFQKQKGGWAGKDPHDKVEVQGLTTHFRGNLYHYTYRDISHHVQTLNSYSSISAGLKTGSVSGAGIFFHTVFTFFKKYILKQGFRDGTRGLIVCLLASFTVMLKYAKLWERRNT